MKIKHYLTVLILLSSTIALAQTDSPKPQWSISAGAGIKNIHFGNSYMDNTYYLDNKSFYLQVNKTHFSPRLSFSASLVYNNYSDHLFEHPILGGSIYPIRYTYNHIGIMLGVQYSWLQKNYWDISSGVEAGINMMHHDIQSQKENSRGTEFNSIGQLNLAKVRFGKKFGGFVQLGYGQKGLIGVGFDYRFKK